MEFHPKTGSRMVFLTEASEAVYGVRREEVLRDTTALTRHIPLEDRARMLKEFADSLTRTGVTTRDFRVVRPDGTTRWLRTHFTRRVEGELLR